MIIIYYYYILLSLYTIIIYYYYFLYNETKVLLNIYNYFLQFYDYNY